MKVINRFSTLDDRDKFLDNEHGKALIDKANSVSYVHRMQLTQATTLQGLINLSEPEKRQAIIDYCDGTYDTAKRAINVITSGNPASNGIGREKDGTYKKQATELAKAYTDLAYNKPVEALSSKDNTIA